MNSQIRSILKEKIVRYLGETQQSMWTLARKAGVPLELINKISRGEDVLCRYRTVSKILFVVDPNDAKAILQEYMETVYIVGIHDKDPVNNQQLMDTALSKVLSSRVNYIVHSLCSTKLGCSRLKVEEALGVQGIQSLEFLLEEGVLVERENGTIYDPLFETLQSDENQLAQMIRYNLDAFEPDHKGSGILNHIDGYSDVGTDKLMQILKKTRLEISQLNDDPKNLGEHATFVSLLTGRVAPWLGKSDSFSIYKKSYDMDQEIAKIVSNIAHDMRGPFHQVMEFVNANSENSNNTIDVHRARRAAKRLDLMIDSLRKMQSHEIVGRQVSLFKLQSILDFSQTISAESGKDFHYDGVNEFLGYLDDEKVERLIQNLIVNAFEAAKSIVVLVCSREDDSLRIIVEDDGSGVPESHVSKLFERGFTLGKRDGTGIGLYNVKTIAQGHDGEAIYERNNGRTRFSVILRNVFNASKLESDVAEEYDADRVEKGNLLFFKANCSAAAQDHIQKAMPEYKFTSAMDDLNSVSLVCTDEPDIAFEASQLDNIRVWLVPKGMIDRKEFIPALKELAHQVYGVRSQA